MKKILIAFGLILVFCLQGFAGNPVDTIPSRTTLKTWFSKGKKPTESQFHQWIDAFYHLDEDTTGIDEVPGLADSLAAIRAVAESGGTPGLADSITAHRTDLDNLQAELDGVVDTVYKLNDTMMVVVYVDGAEDTLDVGGSSGGAGAEEIATAANAGGGENLYTTPGTATANEIADYISGERIPLAQNWKYADTVSVPSGFTFTPDFEIWRNGDGTFSTSIDDPGTFRKTYFPGGKTYYIDAIAGNDANTGLSKSQALQTIAAAVAKTDGKVFMLKGAVYVNTVTFGSAGTKFSVIGYDGTPIIGEIEANPTWSSTTIQGVYKCTTSDSISWPVNPYRVGEMGEFLRYKAAADTSTMLPGEYKYVSATSLYIYPEDGNTPTSTNVLLIDSGSTSFTGSDTIYLENLTVYGRTNFSVGNQVVRIQDVDFFYSPNNDLVSFSDTCNSIIKNVRFGHCINDCIDYDFSAQGVELNCVGRFAGYDYSGSDNQLSTAHNESKVITINADYAGTSNNVILDVNANTQRWVLGGRFKDAFNREPAFNVFALGVGNNTSDFATMWVDGAALGGNTQYDFSANFGAIYLRNVKINATTRANLTNGGSLQKY